MADNIIKRMFQPSERGKVWRAFIFILALVVFGSLIDAGSYYNQGVDILASKTNNKIRLPYAKEIDFKLGLDLQGGTHLVYEANMEEIPLTDQGSALDGVRDVIERRVNVFGVSEPVVQTSISGGDYRVIVELAGVKDANEAIQMIGETPLLEFKEENNEVRELTDEERQELEDFNKTAEEKAVDVLGKVLSAGDFGELAKEFSDDTTTKENGGNLGWITESTNPQIVNLVKDLKVGETTGELVKTAEGYVIAKLNEKRFRTNPFNENETEKEVKASHLLICYEGSEMCTDTISKEEAYEKIKQLKEQATPTNFSDLAKANSTEPGAQERAGDLGWFGRGAMVEPFEVTVFDQAVGTISYVVETKFGYHLIYKEAERDIEELNVSHIVVNTKIEADIVGIEQDWKNTELTGKNLKRSIVQFDQTGIPEVGLEFDSEGADLFADITSRNINKRVAIFLDGFIISAPNVNEKITGGKAVISGNFNIAEAKLLTQRLNAGALPVPIDLISQQTIGASLGKSSLQSSLKAGIIGLILVAVFMIVFYRLPGVLAVFSLTIYGILVLMIFKIWPVTLSLSGMAGFILSIGMAVDANVLIFERLKEELKTGKPLNIAIKDSFNRAWPSIRDGNVSTLLTCLILIWFSTSVVKGFAITLFLGVIVSMFSAIIITKTFLELVTSDFLEKNKWLMGVKNK